MDRKLVSARLGLLVTLGVSALLLQACSTWRYHKPESAESGSAGQPTPLPQLATARLASIESQPIVQSSDQSCWAASAAMIFRFYDPNTPHTETSIAQRMRKIAAGTPSAEGAGAESISAAGQIEVVVALAPEYQLDPERVAQNALAMLRGGKFVMTASTEGGLELLDTLARSQGVLATELGESFVPAQGGTQHPLIVGFSRPPHWSQAEAGDGRPSLGHICVVTGIDYVPDELGSIDQATNYLKGSASTTGEIYAVHYVDPWDGSLHTVAPGVFVERADFVLSRTIALRLLKQIDKTLLPINAGER